MNFQLKKLPLHMFLKELSLHQFKNIEEAALSFSPTLNFIYGQNGAGKTNILDAIHYLSLTKSFINTTDTENIRNNEGFFRIYGKYSNTESYEEFSCVVNREGRKHFKHFTKEYSRLADHIGKLPIVVISPFDHFIITEGSEYRRKLLDSTISQYDKIYLGYLYDYNRILKQRNALLKSEQPEYAKLEMLEIMNVQLDKPANYIFKARYEFIEGIKELFNRYYLQIANRNNELAELEYRSSLIDNEFHLLLKDNLKKDLIAETTTSGIHKDDVLFLLNKKNIRYFASQGQQKTFLTALKLSILDYLKHFNAKPILLLDDIFDKLDDHRVLNLLKTVVSEHIQVFITHTNIVHIEKLNLLNLSESCIFEIENGKITTHEP
ncbi:MAG TPA: DNA replication and repair protein RecF [Bacteroidales bacterium]|nr:DNA replication and repair protein RecF [Bacteroidales bacterium]